MLYRCLFRKKVSIYCKIYLVDKYICCTFVSERRGREKVQHSKNKSMITIIVSLAAIAASLVLTNLDEIYPKE